MPDFLKMPVEIHHLIATNLAPRSVSALTKTCRQLHEHYYNPDIYTLALSAQKEESIYDYLAGAVLAVPKLPKEHPLLQAYFRSIDKGNISDPWHRYVMFAVLLPRAIRQQISGIFDKIALEAKEEDHPGFAKHCQSMNRALVLRNSISAVNSEFSFEPSKLRHRSFILEECSPEKLSEADEIQALVYRDLMPPQSDEESEKLHDWTSREKMPDLHTLDMILGPLFQSAKVQAEKGNLVPYNYLYAMHANDDLTHQEISMTFCRMIPSAPTEWRAEIRRRSSMENMPDTDLRGPVLACFAENPPCDQREREEERSFLFEQSTVKALPDDIVRAEVLSALAKDATQEEALEIDARSTKKVMPDENARVIVYNARLKNATPEEWNFFFERCKEISSPQAIGVLLEALVPRADDAKREERRKKIDEVIGERKLWSLSGSRGSGIVSALPGLSKDAEASEINFFIEAVKRLNVSEALLDTAYNTLAKAKNVAPDHITTMLESARDLMPENSEAYVSLAQKTKKESELSKIFQELSKKNSPMMAEMAMLRSRILHVLTA